MIQCEMRDECTGTVTHIGSKGYIYCEHHAGVRKSSQYESARKLRPWELRWIGEGKTLPTYKPGPEPKETYT